jgi:hypothetical protein
MPYMDSYTISNRFIRTEPVWIGLNRFSVFSIKGLALQQKANTVHACHAVPFVHGTAVGDDSVHSSSVDSRV